MTLKRLLCLFVILTVTVFSAVSCDFISQYLPFGDGNEATLQSIEVVAGSISTTVERGSALDTSGLKIKATYDDESTKEIAASDLTIGRIDTGVVGTHKLTVSYGGLTVSIDITVTSTSGGQQTPTVKSIAYVQDSLVTEFDVGYDFSYDSLKILVTYSDNSTKEIGVNDGLEIGEFNPAIGGTQYLVVSYGGKMTSIEFNIRKLLSGIEFKTDSMSTEFYHLSDTVDISTFEIYALYNDGTKQAVGLYNDALIVNQEEISTAEISTDKTFTVIYSEPDMGTFTIQVPYTVVKSIVSIEVVADSIPATVPVGSKLNTENLAVNVHYSDESEEIVTEGVTASGLSAAQVGTEDLTVTYKSFTDTISIEIVRALVGIEYNSGAPTFFVHKEELDADKDDISDYTIVLTLRYDYGNEVTTETVELTSENADDYTITANISTAEVGVFDITITYLGFNTKTTYTVVKYLESITIDETGFNSKFAHKSSAVPEGLAVTAKYSDGTEETVDGFQIDGFTTENIGTFTFTVSYSNEFGNASGTVPYTVEKAMEYITIDEGSVAKNVYVGSDYNYDNLTFTIHYTDGSTDLDMMPYEEEITAKISTEKAGTQKIAVTYEGLVAEYEVNVIAKLTAIEYIGDELVFDHKATPDVEGKFKLTYNDNTTKEVTISVTDKISAETVGEFNFTASYTEENAIESITVSTANIKYTINKVFASITFVENSCKTVYNPFETVNLDGAKATILYSDGSSDVVDIIIGDISIDTNIIYGNTVKVPFTYGDYNGAFDVRILKVASLAINGSTVTEIDYLYENDVEALLGYDNITVTVTLENDDEIVVYEDITFTNTINVNAVGTYKVNAETKYGTASYDVAVCPAVVSIQYVDGSVATEYFKDRAPDLSTIKLIATYNDGSTKTIGYNDVVITGLDVTQGSLDGVDGTFTVAYTYREKEVTTTVDYTVYTAIEEAIIKIADDKKVITIKYGDEFTLEDVIVGGTFTIKYEGEDATDITESLTVISEFDPENPELGTYTITVSYRGFTDTATLNVYYESPAEEEVDTTPDFDDSDFFPVVL